MNEDAIFRELRPALQELVDALFEASAVLLRKHGNFIPNGAVLRGDGCVTLVVFDPGIDRAVSSDVLPGLASALRDAATDGEVQAVGLAEYVTVTRDGDRPTDAIKVLIEHCRGVSVALYLPFRKRLFNGYSSGEIFWRHVEPEVGAFVLA